MSVSGSEDRPIFVDDTRRRRQVVVTGGAVAGAALAVAALTLVAGFTSAGRHQPPPWPDAAGSGTALDQAASCAADRPPNPCPVSQGIASVSSHPSSGRASTRPAPPRASGGTPGTSGTGRTSTAGAGGNGRRSPGTARSTAATPKEAETP